MSEEQSTQDQLAAGASKRKPPRSLREQVERMVGKSTPSQSKPKPQSDGPGNTRSMAPRGDNDPADPVEDDDEFDDGVGRHLIVGLFIVGLIILCYFAISSIFEKKPLDPAYSKIEGIKKMKELTLVKHYYESVIPIGSPGNKAKKPKIEFLVKAPIEVTGFVDMSDVTIELEDDSLMLVNLPTPKISEPFINFDETSEYTTRKNLWQNLFESKLSAKYTYIAAYDTIKFALDKATEDVKERALANGIIADTEEKAKEYLINAVGAFGYRVAFVDDNEDSGLNLQDSTNLNLLFEKLRKENDPLEAKSLFDNILQRSKKAAIKSLIQP